MSEESLVYEVGDVNPKSVEGVEVICDLLETMDDDEVIASFQDSPLGPYKKGIVNDYVFQIRPGVGLISAEHKNDRSSPEYSYKYSTIDGAIGWILCRVGYGNNISRFEGFSVSASADGEFRGLYSAMEEEPTKREKKRYRQLIENAKKTVTEAGKLDPTESDDFGGLLGGDLTGNGNDSE